MLHRIDPAKDVDGFHPVNVGKLVDRRPDRRSAPRTPSGVQQMLIRCGIETRGAHAVIVGPHQHRRQADGEPADAAGPGGDATVTVCHSRTRDLPAVTRHADILIVAIGKPEFVTGDMVRPGAVVIDVGINRVDDASAPQGLPPRGRRGLRAGGARSRRAITPVPGGVGPMTIAMLLQNTLQAHAAGRADGREREPSASPSETRLRRAACDRHRRRLDRHRGRRHRARA